MRMRVALGWLLVTMASTAGAQMLLPPSPNQFDEKGLRTGHWTITYDSLWRETTNEDSVNYYRLVRFERGIPAGKVRDFYRTGVKQWEGYLSSLSPEVYEGECLTFHENGRLKYRHHYRNGIASGAAEEYYATGQRMSTGEYREGQQSGTWTFYFEDGKVAAVVGFKDNLWNGPALFNHPNGFLDHRGNYIGGKADGKHEFFSTAGVRTMTTHFRLDTLHGPGEFYNEEGNIKEAGLFRNGAKYGVWNTYYPTGQVSSTGNYRGVREGVWTFYHENGNILERGTMKEGMKEGAWERYASDGTREGREEYREGKLHGQSVLYFPDGRLKQQARYAMDSLVGEFLEYGEDGKVVTRGTYAHNQRDGLWTFAAPSGLPLEEGGYRLGLKTGQWKKYSDAGLLARLETYRNDTLDGGYEAYFPSGVRQETGSYRQGKMDGAHTSYHENGKQEITGRYDRGLKQGVWRYYFDSGALQGELTWQDDTLVGPFTFFYPDGTPNVRGRHDRGLRQGDFTYYYPDGKLKATGSFQDNAETGLWIYYDSLSGKKYVEVPYRQGKKHGQVVYYTAGKISSRGYFVDGFEETYQNIRDSVNRLMALKEYDQALAATAWMERVIKRDTKTWTAHALPSSYYSNIYYAQNRPEKSLDYALENLKYHKKNKATGTESYGISAHNVAIAYNGMGQWEKALPYFDESIEIAAKQGINDSYWSSVQGKVYTLADNGQVDAAQRIVRSEWSLAVERFGTDSAATFPLERKIGDFHFYKRVDFEEAARWYEALKPKMERRQHTGPDLFQCYRQLAYIQDNIRKAYTEAIPYYEAGILLAERTDLYIPEYDKLLVDYYSLRIVHAPDEEAAKALYDRILNRVEVVDDPSTRADMYQALGLFAYRTSDYQKAIDFQEKGLALCEASPDLAESQVRATLLQNYAISLHRLPEAEADRLLQVYNQSLQIYAKIPGRSEPDYFVSLIEYGGLCLSYRRFDEAIHALNEGLTILEDGRAQNYRAKAQMYLGQAYEGRFEYHLAIKPFEEAVGYYEQQHTSYLSELETIYASLANCYREDFTKALAAAENALKANIEQHGKDSPQRLNRISRLGELEAKHGLPNQARKRYQEVAEAYATLGRKGSSEYFAALVGVMHADVLMQNYVRARDLGNRILTEAEHALGSTDRTMLTIVYELSLAYEGLRDDKNQERCLQRLVQAFRGQRDDLIGQLSLATYELALGNFYIRRNQLLEAEEILEESVLVVRNTEWAKSSAIKSYVATLAQVKELIGKNAEAEKLYREAFQLATADSANDVTAYVNAGRDLAVFYRVLGRNTEAEALLEELSRFYLRHREADLGYATLRSLLVWLYYLRADEKEALAEANRLLAIAETEGGVGHPTTIGLHNYIGVINFDTDQFEAARGQFQYCVDAMLRRKNLSNAEKEELANYYGNMADVEVALGRIESAEGYLSQGNALRQSTKAVLTVTRQATVMLQEATLSQLKGDWLTAERQWKTVLHNLMTYTQENFVFQSEEEKTRFWVAVSGPFKRFRSFAVDRSRQNPALIGDLYDLQLSTKGILLASSNSIRKRMLGSRDSVMISQYYHWMTLRERLGQRYAQPASRPGEIDSLKRVINELEKEMNVSAEDIRQDKGGPPVTWRQVQASLGPQEAAVEIVRYRYFNRYFRDSTVYVALVLTNQTKQAPALVAFPDGKLLEKQFYAAYKNAIAYQLADTVSYGRYWAPLEKVLGNRHTIYVSLDGVFHQLSLNSLRTPKGKYLADQNTLMLVSNTRDILALKNRKPSKRRSINAALFGFPAFYRGKEEDTKTATDRSGIYPLAGTKTEVDSIAAMLTKDHIRTRVFMGENASEEAIKQLHQPSIVHVATHGFFQAEGKPSAFKLSGVDEENPLNRTGLLLAGAANYALDHEFTGSENGILTAYEVSNLNLESAELVALSACETGKGVVQNGEGVYGLQRAFQSAGAKTILLSLWKVDDEATRQLMTKFYQYWLEGQTKAEALRRAQVAIKVRYPHPYYWAAFVLMEN